MVELIKSACPHDCPSACALEVERLSPNQIGRIRGAKDFDYTAGLVCAKVGRYAERVHHPYRLRHPLKRVGAKGAGEFVEVSWDDALDEVASAFTRAAQRHGSEARHESPPQTGGAELVLEPEPPFVARSVLRQGVATGERLERSSRVDEVVDGLVVSWRI